MKIEAAFIRSLARQLPDATTEVQLPYGRADVVTPTDVFEVESLRNWRTGARQALAYGAMSGRRPNLAVYSRWDVPMYAALDLYFSVRNGPGGLRLWAWSDGLWVAVESEPTSPWLHFDPEAAQIGVAQLHSG